MQSLPAFLEDCRVIVGRMLAKNDHFQHGIETQKALIASWGMDISSIPFRDTDEETAFAVINRTLDTFQIDRLLKILCFLWQDTRDKKQQSDLSMLIDQTCQFYQMTRPNCAEMYQNVLSSANLDVSTDGILAGKMLWPQNIPDELYYVLPKREEELTRLLAKLQDRQAFSIIVIDGLGGLGKTAIGVEIARRAVSQGLFEGVIGESAKQDILTDGQVVHVEGAILRFEQLLDSLARQLNHWEIPTLKLEDKKSRLAQLLRQHNYLILVDNLETVENADALVIDFHKLLGSNRAIITSRSRVRHGFVYPQSLSGLVQEDSLVFLNNEIEQRNVPLLHQISQERLIDIHTVTGGAPLAMKLIVGQAQSLDLDNVLPSLQKASASQEMLYSFVFRQSWEQLSILSQYILIYIGRTVITTVSWNELVNMAKMIPTRDKSQIDDEQVKESIKQLTSYSLLDVVPIKGQMRYSIHQLTRQFVNSELPKIWKEQGIQ